MPACAARRAGSRRVGEAVVLEVVLEVVPPAPPAEKLLLLPEVAIPVHTQRTREPAGRRAPNEQRASRSTANNTRGVPHARRLDGRLLSSRVHKHGSTQCVACLNQKQPFHKEKAPSGVLPTIARPIGRATVVAERWVPSRPRISADDPVPNNDVCHPQFVG